MSLRLLASLLVLGEALEPFKHIQHQHHRHQLWLPKGQAQPGMADFLARQRKAKVVGKHQNYTHERDASTAPMHAQSGSNSTPTQLEMSCATYTGGSCMVMDCDSYRGQTVCGSGYNCVCAPGLCADGQGRCMKDTRAVFLPGTFLIESAKDNQNLYMAKYSSKINTWVGDPGKQGHWHVVVFNDGTIGLTPEEWKYDYWMTVTEECDEDDDCEHQGGNKNQYADGFTPNYVAWELHQVNGKPDGVLCMRHIKSRRFADIESGYVDADHDADEDCMLRFNPPIIDAIKQAKAELHLGNIMVQPDSFMNNIFDD